jgi:hypothetical protein
MTLLVVSSQPDFFSLAFHCCSIRFGGGFFFLGCVLVSITHPVPRSTCLPSMLSSLMLYRPYTRYTFFIVFPLSYPLTEPALMHPTRYSKRASGSRLHRPLLLTGLSKEYLRVVRKVQYHVILIIVIVAVV